MYLITSLVANLAAGDPTVFIMTCRDDLAVAYVYCRVADCV